MPTISFSLLWPAAARALIVAVLAVLAASCVCRAQFLDNAVRRRRAVAWTALLAPFFAPGLLVGYAYAPLAQTLVRGPAWQSVWYAVLLWTRFLPVTVIALRLGPAALTAQGAHCHRLLSSNGNKLAAIWFRWRTAGPAPWVALSVVFLLAFGEFELASLVGIKTWTVAIFDAQAGGLAPGAALRLAIVPALIQMIALGGVLALFAHRHPGERRQPQAEEMHGEKRGSQLSAAVLLGASAMIGAGLPVALLLAGAWRGLPRLTEHPALAMEMATSAGFAVTAALCASGFAALAWRRSRWLVPLLAAPALGGSLLLALGVLALFQGAPVLRQFYDTPLPLLLALSWTLLPAALLFTALRQASRPAEALHAARLAGSQPALLWELDGRTRAGVGFALFCLAYFDLTCSALLAPTGLPLVFVRLYNLAHYGHSAVLSAMLLLAFAAPVAVGLFGAMICRHVAFFRSDR